MDSHQSGLRFLPPPCHHPGWRSHPPHEFLAAPKISSSCLYSSRRKEQEEYEAGKCPPALRPEVVPLAGLERKEPAFSARPAGLPQANFASGGLTIFSPPPPPCEELTSAAPNGNLLRGNPASAPDFAEKRNYEASVLLKPSYAPAGSKERQEDEEEEVEEEEEERNLLPKAPSLDLPQREKTSPGVICKRAGRTRAEGGLHSSRRKKEPNPCRHPNFCFKPPRPLNGLESSGARLELQSWLVLPKSRSPEA